MTAVAWTEIFRDDDAGLVAAAVKSYVATDTKGFHPVPGQIREMMRKLKQPEIMTEVEAWELVGKAIRNGAYHAIEEWEKLPPVIQKIVSPEQIRIWALSEDFNEGVQSSNFMRAYRAKQERQEEMEALPESVKRCLPQFTGKALEGGTNEQ